MSSAVPDVHLTSGGAKKLQLIIVIIKTRVSQQRIPICAATALSGMKSSVSKMTKVVLLLRMVRGALEQCSIVTTLGMSTATNTMRQIFCKILHLIS